MRAEREEMDGGREPGEKMRYWKGGGGARRGSVWELVATGEESQEVRPGWGA